MGFLKLVLASAVETFDAGWAGGLLRVFLHTALAILLLLNGLRIDILGRGSPSCHLLVYDRFSGLARRTLDRIWRPRVIPSAWVDHGVAREGILIVVRLKLVQRDCRFFGNRVVTLTLLILDKLLLKLHDLLDVAIYLGLLPVEIGDELVA